MTASLERRASEVFELSEGGAATAEARKEKGQCLREMSFAETAVSDEMGVNKKKSDTAIALDKSRKNSRPSLNAN
jgi:hypothetical protein